ncbi:MAG: hypothetical protein JJU19_08850, partial [Pararhodobacter sp.]|nr:hypothetical protein [Pararhodobacter sp.]
KAQYYPITKSIFDLMQFLRDGRFIALDGRNRLMISRLLALTSIPVRIVLRHREWSGFRRTVAEHAATLPSGELRYRLDHPDLRVVPFTHKDRRVSVILKAMNGYDARGKTLVDIGSDLGSVSRGLAQRGFRCIALAADARTASLAGRISRAFDGDLTVANADPFDFPDIEKADVVVALDILDYLVPAEASTEPSSRSLAALLMRMRTADALIVQLPEAASPDQAALPPGYPGAAEFIGFLKHHTGLQNARSAGSTQDGRELFILWRDGTALAGHTAG